MQRTTQISQRHPRGFSMIEILVVIGIIAALMALSLVVLGTSQNAANIAATRATILKANALLRDRVAGWNKQFASANSAYDLKGSAQANFPQNANEATLGIAYADWVGTNTVNAKADSSELLYLTLTAGTVRGSSPVDSDSFNGRELDDTDNDGFLEIIDAWGNPIQFYRWPTRLLNPFGFVATQVDSASPVGVGDLAITVDDASGFDSVLNDVRNTSIGGDATASIFVVIGDEIIEVTGLGFSTVKRGAAGTSAEAHHAGATVKLAPFPKILSLVFGSLTMSAATHDPDDARGSLLSESAVVFEDDFHTLDSYHTPLIISAGPDEILGILEPSLDGTGLYNRGNLAQPDTNNGADISIIVEPGNSALSDNISNVGGGN